MRDNYGFFLSFIIFLNIKTAFYKSYIVFLESFSFYYFFMLLSMLTSIKMKNLKTEFSKQSLGHRIIKSQKENKKKK